VPAAANMIAEPFVFYDCQVQAAKIFGGAFGVTTFCLVLIKKMQMIIMHPKPPRSPVQRVRGGEEEQRSGTQFQGGPPKGAALKRSGADFAPIWNKWLKSIFI
jgi:hypothetical protein